MADVVSAIKIFFYLGLKFKYIIIQVEQNKCYKKKLKDPVYLWIVSTTG